MALADLSSTVEPLELTPGVLRAVIRGRPDEWLARRHGPDVFSPRETVAHLVLCERDWSWIDRTKKILDPNYAPKNEEEVTEAELLSARSVTELLDEFERLRTQCLQQLRDLQLTTYDLEKLNTKGNCSVAQLLATWVAHDLYHLGQMFKSFAAPYQAQIGPYQEYLNIPHFN